MNNTRAFIPPLTKMVTNNSKHSLVIHRHLRTVYEWLYLCLTETHFTYEEDEAQTGLPAQRHVHSQLQSENFDSSTSY